MSFEQLLKILAITIESANNVSILGIEIGCTDDKRIHISRNNDNPKQHWLEYNSFSLWRENSPEETTSTLKLHFFITAHTAKDAKATAI